MIKLIFGKANAKLRKLEKLFGRVFTFSVLSGHTCPYAKDCHSKAVEIAIAGLIKRKIWDSVHTLFRCFSASQEVQYNGVYDSRKSNMAIIEVAAKSAYCAALIILRWIPKLAKVIRIHVGGDFKTQAYFDAWIKVAQSRPDVLFYAYTKSLPFWVKRLDVLESVPNLVLTASRGGHRDDLISKHNLREAVVVYSEAEAEALGLEIDHDDSHAADPARRHENFALLLHGSQPAGSDASKALQVLKRGGWTGYGKDKGREKVA
jgi:hypothetical protein